MFKRKTHNKQGNFDKGFFVLIIILLFVGLVAVADSSAPQALSRYGDKFYLFKQQFVWAIFGMIALFVTTNIKYTYWEKVATPLFFIGIFFLLVVLLPHLGFKALGARRWIDLGFFSFQPSEIIKLGLSLFLAKVASKNKPLMSYFVPFIAVCALVMLQPDLGTTMIISVMAMSQIFISGISLTYLLGSVTLGIGAVLGLILISPYRRERLLTFLQIERDPLGSSYHIKQVLLGLGSGGLFGVGLGASRQKYLFLPESSTDSVFAVIAEELGFLGGMGLIIIFIIFVYKGLHIAKGAPDTFGRVLATGIVAWIGGQAFLNIASMVSLVPLTGIPLPFFSYGGSSLVMVMGACGILLNISRFREMDVGKLLKKNTRHRL